MQLCWRRIFGKANIKCVIITHKAAGKIIGEKENDQRIGEGPNLARTNQNWKMGRLHRNSLALEEK